MSAQQIQVISLQCHLARSYITLAIEIIATLKKRIMTVFSPMAERSDEIPRPDLSAGVEDKGLSSAFVGIVMSIEISSNSYINT